MSKICGHCRRTVDQFEGIVDEFIWYHSHCYYLITKKRVDKLQGKFKGGTITLNEAEELSELDSILANVKKTLHEPIISMDEILGQNTPNIFGESDGIKKLNQSIKKLRKHNELDAGATGKPNRLSSNKKPVFGISNNDKH